MESRVSIGAFAAASHLSVKTLRHYHEVGLLEPSEVDPNSGYRYYSYEQIPTAQVIRRLRALDMPVGELRAVLAAPDPEEAGIEVPGVVDQHVDAAEAVDRGLHRRLR
jgi:DNA-binding transcriptional MerR regulator